MARFTGLILLPDRRRATGPQAGCRNSWPGDWHRPGRTSGGLAAQLGPPPERVARSILDDIDVSRRIEGEQAERQRVIGLAHAEKAPDRQHDIDRLAGALVDQEAVNRTHLLALAGLHLDDVGLIGMSEQLNRLLVWSTSSFSKYAQSSRIRLVFLVSGSIRKAMVAAPMIAVTYQ